MKIKQLLTKSLLTAAMLCIGAGNMWADRVYFNDFSTGNGTTAPDGLTIHGDGTFIVDDDANFGKVFKNGGGAQRTHYLQLPNNVLSHSATSKKMTIGFWVSAKNAGESSSYMWAPIFTAYAAAPSNNTNTSPMFACQYRGVLQVNNSGWCDYVDAQNIKGSNTLYHDNTDWLADDGWHYYTAVFEGENAYVYFDGVLKNQWLATTDYNNGTQDITDTTQDGLFTAGSALTYICLGGNQAWNLGDNDAAFMFDDFAVYDEALSAEQITQIMKEKNKEVLNAIANCKAYETSDAFASHIDAGSYATAAEVYAAHSAWQIAQAEANNSTDFSKAIMNRSFELCNTNGWTIYGDAATGTNISNKDAYGIVEYGNDWSQYYTGWNGRNVSQTIATLPAGTYRLTAYCYSWGEDNTGATVKLFANGSTSANQGGTNEFSTTFDFTVTGSEESIKIGIGGVGQGSGDNTWGTWGYRVKDFTLTRTGVSATITAAGAATFVSNYNLDFSNVEGLEAYIATAQAGANVTFDKVTGAVPAGTPLYLRGTTADVPVVASADPVGTNLLVAGTGAAVASEADGKYNFILNKVGDVVGFYKAADNTVASNRAYLSLSTNPFPTGGAKSVNMIFGGETTGINTVAAQSNETGVKGIYNMQGQRVYNPTKGLYIVDGKKVAIP